MLRDFVVLAPLHSRQTADPDHGRTLLPDVSIDNF
jgi:hypothetical protein